jgi:hypothetical protein
MEPEFPLPPHERILPEKPSRLKRAQSELHRLVLVVESRFRVFWSSPVTGWGFVIVFSCVAVYWYFKLPYSGFGVLGIALVAAVMQARSPGHTERGFLIVLIGVFAIIEARAIQHDHFVYNQQEQQATQQEQNRFQALLDSEKQSFSDLLTHLIDHEDSNMRQVLSEQRRDFRTITSEASSARKDESRELSSVIDQQKSVLQRQEELYEFSAGVLLPGNEQTPTTGCRDAKPADFFVQTGDFWWDISTLPFNAIVSKGLTIKLDKGPGGSLVLAVDMRWDDGRIIAKIDKNTYIINNKFNVLQYKDKNSLRLMDETGKDVLSVRYLNSQTVTIAGAFRRRGQWQDISMGFIGCTGVSGTGTGMTIGE